MNEKIALYYHHSQMNALAARSDALIENESEIPTPFELQLIIEIAKINKMAVYNDDYLQEQAKRYFTESYDEIISNLGG